jgi:hypothetical protein
MSATASTTSKTKIILNISSMTVIPTTTMHIARLASRAESLPSPECTTAVPGKYGRVDDYSACNAYYTYNPSFAAAILFTVLFGILTISHTTQAFWYKKGFPWIVSTGVLFELTSFVCRTLGSRDQQNVGLATASQLLFLLAPLCESTPKPTEYRAAPTFTGIHAFVYMSFGRLVQFFHRDRRCAGLKASSIAKYFVWADIASFLVQAAGGSMLNPGNGADAQKIGLKLYMAGVGVQEGFIVRSQAIHCVLVLIVDQVVFTGLGARFVREMLQVEAHGRMSSDKTGWRLQMWSIFTVLALITVSSHHKVSSYADICSGPHHLSTQ